MNILIDIGHPAHVHVFRHFAKEMEERGHLVLFTAKKKECTIDLLEAFDLNYVLLGNPFSGAIKKVYGLYFFGKKLLGIAKRFEADLFLSISSMYAAHVAFLMGKKHIVLDDTEHSTFEHWLYRPFSQYILNPSCFEKYMGPKQILYDGYHELAYLAPNRFQPKVSSLAEAGIDIERPYTLLRFVSWNAGHDIKQSGLRLREKIELVNQLKAFGSVYISSEKELPEELEAYRVRIKPEQMHDVLAAAHLYVGEGASMASECAMLGTPAIYVNSLDAGTLKEQQDYGLIYNFRQADGVLETAKGILSDANAKEKQIKRRDIMLEQKVDVTELLVRLSCEVLREGELSDKVITRFNPLFS